MPSCKYEWEHFASTGYTWPSARHCGGTVQRHGYIARGGQAIDATLVPAPRQHLDRHGGCQRSCRVRVLNQAASS